MTVTVKICGLTNVEDAACAVEAGADMLGFIFAAKSPRYVSPERAHLIVAALADVLSKSGATSPKLVGVFVDSDLGEIEYTMAKAGLDYAQLHGSEPVEMLSLLDERAYKAIRPRPDLGGDVVPDALAYAANGITDGPRLLVDAYSPHAQGGTGEVADWGRASNLAGLMEGFMLAGGLTPSNVGAAIKAVKPWGVDASSGVELSPGRKNHELVRSFVRAAKTAIP